MIMAALNAAVALDAEDICAICRSEQKVDPVVLECGHSYCSNCLVELLDHCIPPSLDDPTGITDRGYSTNQPSAPPAPIQPDTTQGSDSDLGLGFSCPQCRRPILLDILQNQTSSIHIRIDHISQDVQRQFRRRRSEMIRSSYVANSLTFSHNQLSQLLVFCLAMTIFGLIQTCMLSLNAGKIRKNPKCQPIELSRIFNGFCLLLAVLGCSLVLCKAWLHVHRQLALLYRFAVLVCLIFVVSDIVQAVEEFRSLVEGCTRPVATISTVFVSCINGVLFFLVSTIIENPSSSLRQTLNTRLNQVEPTHRIPPRSFDPPPYHWTSASRPPQGGPTSGNQEAIITITTSPTTPMSFH